MQRGEAQRVHGHDAVAVGDRRRPSTSSLLGPHGHARARRGDHAARRSTRRSGSASSPACAAPALSARRSSRSSSSTSTAPAGRSPRSTARSRERGIFGGNDLSARVPGARPERARTASPRCTRKADIDRLAEALAEVICDERRRPTTLRPFHQASWNEPIILELSSPGERGLDPAAGRARDRRGRRRRRLGDPGRRCAARRPPALPELSQPQVLRHFLRLSQETLGERRQHPPRPGHLHDEVQPEGERAADPLARGRATCTRRRTTRPSRGILEIDVPLRADPLRDLRDGPRSRSSPAAAPRRSTRTRAMIRAYHAARGERAARRDHHDDLLAPVRRRRPGDGRLQGRHALPGRDGLPGARRAQGRACPSAPPA